MKSVFVDTSGWIGLVNTSDSLHDSANRAYQSKYIEGCLFVTHLGIMLETGNGLSALRLRSSALGLKRKLEKSERVEILDIDSDLYEAGWELFAKRPDKAWGIVDCISFALMTRLNIGEALTADRHFEQAGFSKLL
jgi:uncharacterized protein